MVVHLEMTGSMVKDLVKAIENVNEECVWNFDSQGLHIRMSDIYKYKMLDISLNSEDFISYSCDVPVKMGIVIDRIKDVSKTLKTKDTLILSSTYNPENPETESYITLKANGLSRSVKLIDVKMVSEVPSLSGAESALAKGFKTTVKSEPFKNFLKAASKSLSFDVVVENGGLSLQSKTEEGLVSVDYLESDILLTPVSYEGNTQYSVKEIEAATSTMNGMITMRGCAIDSFGEGGLIEISWLWGENSTVRALVAPRV